MKSSCPDCEKKHNKHHHNLNEQNYTELDTLNPYNNHNSNDVDSFEEKINSIQKQKMPMFKPIDVYHIKKSLFEAILFPEYSKGFKFPARIFFLILIISFPGTHLYIST